MARDPVCGMNVRDDKNNLRSEFRGQNYFFCSDKCQKEFDRNPQSFVRDRENRDNLNQNVNQNKDIRNRNDNRDNRDDRRPR